jgi:hypothetical protein
MIAPSAGAELASLVGTRLLRDHGRFTRNAPIHGDQLVVERMAGAELASLVGTRLLRNHGRFTRNAQIHGDQLTELETSA